MIVPKKVVDVLQEGSFESRVDKVRGAVERAFENRFDLPPPAILATFSDHVVAIVEDRVVKVPVKPTKNGGFRVSDPSEFEEVDWEASARSRFEAVRSEVRSALNNYVAGNCVTEDLEDAISSLIRVAADGSSKDLLPDPIDKVLERKASEALEVFGTLRSECKSCRRAFEKVFRDSRPFRVLYETALSKEQAESFRPLVQSTNKVQLDKVCRYLDVLANPDWVESLREDKGSIGANVLVSSLCKMLSSTKECLELINGNLLEVSFAGRMADDLDKVLQFAEAVLNTGDVTL